MGAGERDVRGGLAIGLMLVLVAFGVWAVAVGPSPAPSSLPAPEHPIPVPLPSSAPPDAKGAAPEPQLDAGPARPTRTPAIGVEQDPHGAPGDTTFPEFACDDEYFDPAAFRAVAGRWLKTDEAALRTRLGELAGSQRNPREDIDLEKLALLLAFLFRDGARAMPPYMIVDDTDWVVAILRATFPAWPILEQDGIPFLLPSLAFDLSETFTRRGGSYGVSGRDFPAWALSGSRRSELPNLTADPLQAADELAQRIQTVVRSAGKGLHELRIPSLRDQAFRCLGERARRSAAAELGMELEWSGRWFREERVWLQLRDWIAGQPMAWDAGGRYELRER